MSRLRKKEMPSASEQSEVLGPTTTWSSSGVPISPSPARGWQYTRSRRSWPHPGTLDLGFLKKDADGSVSTLDLAELTDPGVRRPSTAPPADC